jgi:uncharacterized protein (DUF1800 family)
MELNKSFCPLLLAISFILFNPVFAAQLAAGPASASASTSARAPALDNSEQKALHVINRLTFGPRPGDLETVEKTGVENFIETQLHPDRIGEDPDIEHIYKTIPGVALRPMEVWNKYNMLAFNRLMASKGIAKKEDNPKQYSATLIQMTRLAQYFPMDARYISAVDSPRQLQEVMTDFWFNHFSVFRAKGYKVEFFVGSYADKVIRRNAFGKFRDLLGATCHHPAMIDYLDNSQNYRPGYKDKDGQTRGLNENYARELMELHALGVDGGYTQKDVIELARILSGLNLPDKGDREQGLGYRFFPKRHDFGDKVLLGHTIKGSGAHEIEEALDILACHPATARHICYQLAQHFVCDQPPDALVDKLAQDYTRTGGDIRSILSTLFHC